MDRLLGVLPPVCLAISFFLSFYTTHAGIVDIIRSPLAAIAFTLVVQLLLVFCSWNLGKMIGRYIVNGKDEGSSAGALANATRHAFFWTTFGIAFAVSVFFSFSYYFNAIFSKEGQQIVQESLPNDVIAAIAPGLRRDVATAEREGSRTVLDGESKAWLAEVGAVVQLAKDQNGGISEIFDRRREAQRQRELAAERERAAAEAAVRAEREQTQENLKTAQRRQAELQFRLKQLEERLQPLRAEKAELETGRAPLEERRAAAQAEADKQKLGVEGRKRGEGPEYRKAMDELIKAQRDLVYYNGRITRVDAQIREVQGSIAEAQAELGALPADVRRLEGELAVEQISSSDTAPARVLPASLQVHTLEGFIQETERLGTAFRAAPGRDTYVALTNACQMLLEPLQSIGRAGAHDCRSDAAFQELVAYDDRRPRLIAAREKFQQQCSEARTQEFVERVAGRSGNEPFNEAVALLRGCIQAAGAGGADAAQWNTALTQFIKQNSLERDRFSITLDAPLLGPSQFVIGILMSFAQDILILSLGVFWEIHRQEDQRGARRRLKRLQIDVSERPDDPAHLAAAKAVLRLLEAEKADRSMIKTKSHNPEWEALPRAVRSNAAALLNRLVRSRLARSTDEGFVIFPTGVRELEEEVAVPTGHGGETNEVFFETEDGRRRPRPRLLRT